MQANKRQMLFMYRTIARTARALVVALACAAVGNAVAADWEVWPETKDGMTGAQQITNALTKLNKGDTIRVNPGTYDFTGIWMTTYSKTVGTVTYTITNHLARNCNYSLVGVTDGHWDNEVVFTGNRRCLDSHKANGMDNCNVTIRNITFEGFDAGEYPSGASFESRGGALRLTDSVTTVDIVSNCVIRNCHANYAGAVNGGVLIDCLVTGNSSTGQGGATCNTCIRNCQFKNNASGNYGAFYNHTGIYNTLFENNTCSSLGGAGQHAAAYPITNCVFRNNTAQNIGGALYANATTANVGDIVDCRFEGNRAKSRGGAIYQGGADNIVPPRIRLCSFTGNVSSEGDGGAIYHDRPLYDRPIVDCGFTNNYVQGSQSGGAVVNGVYSNCTFVGNGVDKGLGGAGYFSKSGGVYRCTFVDNVSANGYGGALYVDLNMSFPFAWDCSFASNRVCGTEFGGGGAVVNGVYSNCTFVGNGADKGCGGAGFFSKTGGVYRCTFIDNVSTNGSGGAIYVDNLATTFLFARDCSFVSNRVCGTGGGGAVYRGSYSNCVFTANVCSNGNGGAAVLTRSYGGAATDCAFVGNICWTNGYGGAVYCSDDACPFTRCAFTNNFAWKEGGALYRGACTNCTFVGNHCVVSRGASIRGDVNMLNPYLFKSTAVNCLFKDNYRRDSTGRTTDHHTEYQGGDVCGTRMENCEVIDGSGSFWHCSIVNSHFHDMTNKLGHCVFGEESWVTNCLVDHCNLANRGAAFFYRSHYMPDSSSTEYRGRVRGAWVNCTFADNTLNDSWGMVGVYANWCDKNYGPHAVCDFVNCIFYNNRKKNGTLADISGQTAIDVTYSNCVYGASDGTLKYGTTDGWTNVGGTFVCEDPRFAKDRAAKLECTYYTPRANSSVLGKGDARFYTATDVDLAGKPRMREGKVDLGAYQCWLKVRGITITFR